ncbi:MAG: hypothetical protein DRO04_00570 [Candidatus Iainarchaeum archaeon]|uniref:Transcription factor E n=1 Tax=Candidatus Iainarchaeum sp. TaxID=3101447 RepID=A0A497JJE9_9ARCH|nr:MAG: hypothetical protein DRO04_00570 [Candidatus Diapherotrites archaeon]
MAKKSLISLKIVRDYLYRLGGEDAVKLVEIVLKKKQATDEEINKKLKHLRITEVRALLNRLHFYGITYYSKKKDMRSGWYSYTWKIRSNRIAELILAECNEKINKLKEKLEVEADRDLFICNNKCDLVPFEIAAEYRFRCPICGGAMNIMDSKTRSQEIKKELKKMEKEVEILKKISQNLGQS